MHLLALGSKKGKGLHRQVVLPIHGSPQPASSASGWPSSASREEPALVVETARRLDKGRP